MDYRTDIDGLRAVAVVSVLLFHLGYVTNGYLGVDIFFVISGFLITNIIYTAAAKEEFSFLKFYERRIRRIIPLLLFVSLAALITGIIVMLPEDLENLAQSVIASNFSINNILMYITSGDYWATKNEFKPLMHTWSLGVEEQYYLLYPFIFYFLQGKKVKFTVVIIGLLALLSLLAFFIQKDASSRFYLIQYRLFELAIGGLGSISLHHFDAGKIKNKSLWLGACVAITLLLVIVPYPSIRPLLNVLVTISTSGILVLGSQYFNSPGVYSSLFGNRLIVGIGKASYSIYMWHQLVLAFARYAGIEAMTISLSLILSVVTLMLSVVTYNVIERPFRNPLRVRTRYVLVFCGAMLLLTTIPSFYIHSISGIVKDYPELGFTSDDRVIKRNLFTSNRNVCIKYIDDVDALIKDFSDTDKTKILVIGNSFGRDVANILMEYDSLHTLEVRYFRIHYLHDPAIKKRLVEADRIILAAKDFIGRDTLKTVERIHQIMIDDSKVWLFGTKDFGYHNGVHHFKYSKETDFRIYRTPMKEGVKEVNDKLREEWSGKFVDLISVVSEGDGRVLVYTPDGKFLSHDTLHLTKYGAVFFARKLRKTLDMICNNPPPGPA